MSDLARRALAVNQANLALRNEVFRADGALFVRNRTAPLIRDANHVAHVSAATPAEIERLLARVEVEFAGIPHRMFALDPTTPRAFVARLVRDGYELAEQHSMMVLEGTLAGEARPYEVRRLDGPADWAAFRSLHAIAWAELRARLGVAIADVAGEQMAGTKRAKSPPVRYWLACLDGAPRGYLSSWEGTDRLGQVEDLFVHPGFRHRGLATALIHRCVRDCRERGAGPIAIVADPTDTPERMYRTLGFRPVATTEKYLRAVRE
jgi:ribosomal protein S18 acetylase RimI-like enzyme